MNNKFELNNAVLDILDLLSRQELSTCYVPPIQADAVETTETEPEAEAEPEVPAQEEKPMSAFKRNKLRLMAALDTALKLTEEVDFVQGEKMRERLTRGAYPTAFIKDVFSLSRLKQLFNFIQWTEVTTRVTTDQMTVLQASLPKQVVAYAAWCELAELKQVPGGLQSVKVLADSTNGELYLATPMRRITKYVTAVLLKDDAGVERLLHWFPGKEISGTIKDGLNTQIVRTGWKL